MLQNEDIPYWENLGDVRCTVILRQRSLDHLQTSLSLPSFPADWMNSSTETIESVQLSTGESKKVPSTKGKTQLVDKKASNLLNAWVKKPALPEPLGKVLEPGDWVLAYWPKTKDYHFGKIPTEKQAQTQYHAPPIDRAAGTCIVKYDDEDVRLDCPLHEVTLEIGRLTSRNLLLKKVSLLCGYPVHSNYTLAELVSNASSICPMLKPWL
jgi:hypothetical protein